MRSIRLIVFSFSLLSFGVTSNAQDVTISSIEEAIELALKRNFDFQNYTINQQKASLEYKQAKRHRLPTISGTFNGQRNIDLATTPLPGEIFGQPGEVVDAQFGQEYTYNAGINISKQFFDRNAYWQKKIASLNQDITNVEKEVFEQLLKEQVITYYYTAVIAKRAVEISQTDMDAAQKIHQLSAEKFNEGLIDAISMNTAIINENTVRQSLNANSQLALQCEMELKKLLGIRPEDQLSISEDLNNEFPEKYQIAQLSIDPTLRNTELQLQQSDLLVKQSKSASLPSLSVNTYYGRQQFREDFGLSLNPSNWSNYSYLSVNLNVPIFTGFRNKSEVKQNRFNYQIQQNNNHKAKIAADLDDQLLIQNYLLSLDDAKATYNSYQLYAENRELNHQKFEEGLISLDAYLKVFEDYVKAENNYLNTLTRVYTYYSQILPRIQS